MARLTKKQSQMLEALEKSGGNVAASTEQVGIARQTHYNWLDSNERYRQEVENLDERTIDVAEYQLLKNVQKGNQKAIEFFLDRKARHRGYGKVLGLEGGTGGPIPLANVPLSDEQLEEELARRGITAKPYEE